MSHFLISKHWLEGQSFFHLRNLQFRVNCPAISSRSQCHYTAEKAALYADTNAPTTTTSYWGTRLTNWITIIPEQRPGSFSLFIQGNNEPKWVQAAVDKHIEKCQYTPVGTVHSKLFKKYLRAQLTPILQLQKRPRQEDDTHAHQTGSWNEDGNLACLVPQKCKIVTFWVLIWTSFPFFSSLKVR